MILLSSSQFCKHACVKSAWLSWKRNMAAMETIIFVLCCLATEEFLYQIVFHFVFMTLSNEYCFPSLFQVPSSLIDRTNFPFGMLLFGKLCWWHTISSYIFYLNHLTTFLCIIEFSSSQATKMYHFLAAWKGGTLFNFVSIWFSWRLAVLL